HGAVMAKTRRSRAPHAAPKTRTHRDPTPKRELIGVLRGDVVEPFDADDGPPLTVVAKGSARDGDAVVAARLPATKRHADAAKVVETLGQVEDPGVDGEVVARRHHLRRTFPEAVRIHAARIDRKIPDAELKKRERFDRPSPVTIDGETARDFDDAIAV